MTGTGSFCPSGWNIVALSITPSRIGIFTPQSILGIGSADAPDSCARLRVAHMPPQSMARRITRSTILVALMAVPPPEHRPIPFESAHPGTRMLALQGRNSYKEKQTFQCKKGGQEFRKVPSLASRPPVFGS